jgi:HAD superfamily hydrolase (TIGR01490 family)
MSGAAFFDLDRTLLSRSSSLALARPFRKRGLIGRRQLVAAVIAQAVFVRVGAGHGRVGQTADSAMTVLQGLPVELIQEIAEEAWVPVLRPLVYREAVDLAAEHSERGEPVYIVSAALQEVVDTIARNLKLDGALGSRAETRDGVYTGRLERRLYGPAKVEALVELAEARGLDLRESTGYSDSYTDLAFLEAVGRPVAVNPDRALRRIAAERGWPVVRFHEQLQPA